MWPWRLISGCVLVLGAGVGSSATPGGAAPNPPLPLVTNLAHLSRLGEGQQQVTCSVRLEGVVAWAGSAGNQFVLRDDSGAELLETEPPLEPLQAGDLVTVEGIGSREGTGAARRLGSMVLLNNDGVHGLEEKAGTVVLTAGKHPLRVGWFTRDTPPLLEVWYEGPGVPRQKIPRGALFRREPNPDGGGHRWVEGLDYRAYEGEWWQLPEFRYWAPARLGTATNFDLALRTRDQYVGLSFSGCIEIPRDGRYTFSTVSDGGSRLYLQLLRVRTVRHAAPPEPELVPPGQSLPQSADSQWAALEGLVTFAARAGRPGWELELSSPAAHVRVELAEATGSYPALLANCRVRVTGLCRRAHTPDGQGIPGVLWVPDEQQLQVLDVPPELWTATPVVPLGTLAAATNPATAERLVHVRARVRRAGGGVPFLVDGTGSMALVLPQPGAKVAEQMVEVLGICRPAGSNLVLQSVFYRPVKEAPESPAELPLLTTVEQIKRLKRSEALRGYPVRVRGTITWSAGSAVVIQDATAGIFVSEVPVADADGLRAGESWEITGISFAQFSPMILARRVLRLGLAPLPEPVRPTWDQLINGSLDTQFVELSGIVTGLRSNTVTLLTHGGKIKMDLPEARPEQLRQYDGTLIRVRGCLWAAKDESTHVFRIGEVEMHNAAIAVDQPAPIDPFAAPRKRAAELLLYDAEAGPFQRVAVSGLVIHRRGGEYYLMDGKDGLRFVPREASQLQPGDQVEVVGFPELGGPSPVLREAVARRTGHAPLPEASQLSEDTLLASRFDSTRVRVRAQLVKVSVEQKDQVLSLQVGPRNFVARLNGPPEAGAALRVGSQLELTGAYVGHGGDRAAGRDIDSFELLLNGPADIRVLAQPPWWTLRRLLAAVGVLVAVLGIALVWIGLLRRQVEQRTAQLKTQIHEREQAEYQRAVEAERSRIARDLHDDLGSSLTEISLLADAGPGSPASLERAGQRFRLIGDKARAAVNALDVIVWLVNPRKDVLPFLAGYLASYAEEYLSASGVACRLKIPRDLPPIRLTAEVRHSLFLAVKESLRNIVCHAHASEVLMELSVSDGRLAIAIADNGRGFEYGPALDGNGLANLRDRLTGVGGRCEIVSRPEAGTRVSLVLPLNCSDLHPL